MSLEQTMYSPLPQERPINKTEALYKGLLAEALEYITETFKEQGGRAWMVSGPIGSGSVAQENIARIRTKVAELTALNEPVLDQTRWHNSNYSGIGIEHSNQLKLDTFYKPLIASGKIKGLYMLPGWETSVGAQVEHTEAIRCGLEIKLA